MFLSHSSNIFTKRKFHYQQHPISYLKQRGDQTHNYLNVRVQKCPGLIVYNQAPIMTAVALTKRLAVSIGKDPKRTFMLCNTHPLNRQLTKHNLRISS